MRSVFLLGGSLACLAASAIAQPFSLHTVARAGAGEMWRVDHGTNTATQMTIPAVLSGTEPVNCIMMTSPVTGYVGSNSTNSKIFAITVSGNTVTLGNNGQALNTTATAGGNLAQIVELLGRLYFTTQGGGAGGVLQSIPVTGGAVTTELDLASLTNPTAPGLTNALAKVGLKLYIGTWYSGTTQTRFSEIVEFDPLSKSSSVLLQIPPGKFKATTAQYGIGIVHMHEVNGNLGIVGVYGDNLEVDVNTKTIVKHECSCRQTSATTMSSNSLNSFHPDPTGNDWVVGSRDGHVERIVDGHSAEKIIPIGTGTSSVNGSWYFPEPKNSDKTMGPGCPGAGGYTPTDVAMGAAVSPNPNFQFALHSGNGGDPFVLALGISTTSIKIGPCTLYVSPVLIVGGTLAGSGNGAGTARIKAPIPAGLKNVMLDRQWAAGSTLSVSNTRRIEIK